MLINSKRITQICKKYSISIEQFWILYLRITDDWENLQLYCDDFTIKLEIILDLEAKGYIEPLHECIKNRTEPLEMFDISPIGEIIDKLFVESKFAGTQLFTVFPKYIKVNGNTVVATQGETINGTYYDKDKLIEVYSSKIGHDKELHTKILNAVKIGKDRNLINFVLRKFIMDELWENLFEIIGEVKETYKKSISI